jgi:hypothetical protein
MDRRAKVMEKIILRRKTTRWTPTSSKCLHKVADGHFTAAVKMLG